MVANPNLRKKVKRRAKSEAIPDHRDANGPKLVQLDGKEKRRPHVNSRSRLKNRNIAAKSCWSENLDVIDYCKTEWTKFLEKAK